MPVLALSKTFGLWAAFAFMTIGAIPIAVSATKDVLRGEVRGLRGGRNFSGNIWRSDDPPVFWVVVIAKYAMAVAWEIFSAAVIFGWIPLP